MTELERRALLGDVQAQKECTKKGIVLPCPCCGAKANSYENSYLHHGYVECTKCACRADCDTRLKALSDWNTRPAPPIGKCGECAKLKRGGSGYGWCNGFPKMFYQFCDKFTPKED